MAMEIALIIPPQFVEHTNRLSGRFCIAPVALQFDEYRRFFVNDARSGNYNVILDNGAWEGELIDDKELLDLAMVMHPQVIVAPDLFGGSADESFAKSLEWIGEADEAFKTRSTESYNPEYMVVCQTTPRDDVAFWRNVENCIEDERFQWLGFPRIALTNAFGQYTRLSEQETVRYYFATEMARRGLVDKLKAAGKKVHFLGVGDRWHFLPAYWWVDSMDTASIFWQSVLGNTVTLDGVLNTREGRPKDYFTRALPAEANWEGAFNWNCKYIQKWVQEIRDTQFEVATGVIRV